MAKTHIKYEHVKTEAVLTLQEKAGHWDIAGIELHVSTQLPEREEAKFQKAAKAAKTKCPIWRALKVPIKMSAHVAPVEEPAFACTGRDDVTATDATLNRRVDSPGIFRISEGKMDKLKTVVDKLKIEAKQTEKVCTMCGKPATRLVDGEPSCADHVEQVYEHQVEDYTCKHLTDHAAREV